jgi:hypothetical protein
MRCIGVGSTQFFKIQNSAPEFITFRLGMLTSFAEIPRLAETSAHKRASAQTFRADFSMFIEDL